MKKISRKISALIAMAMLVTTLGLGVMTAEPVSAASVPAPTGLKYVAGYNSVQLSWNKVSGAQGYKVAWKDHTGKVNVKPISASSNHCVVNNLTIRDSTDNLKTYNVNVFAIKGGKASAPSSIRVQPVRKMTITVTLKKTKSYFKGSNKIVRKKGERVVTDSYKGGAYRFKQNGRWCTFSRIAGKNASADYIKPGKKNLNGDNNYTSAEAENFINSYVKANKINSGKKYLVWVSSYSQRTYIFEKKSGAWKYKDSWDCSMGKASTPSPTGNCTLHKKIRFRHGIKSWNCYASLNALHGVKGSWGKKLGKLASHGCIRNKQDGANWIYKNCAKGTKIIVY